MAATTTFKEYARIELISILSNLKSTDEPMFINGFVAHVAFNYNASLTEIYKLLSNRAMRNGLLEFYKENQKELFNPKVEFIEIFYGGNYLVNRMMNVLEIIMKHNIQKIYNRYDDDLMLFCNKETFDKIKAGLTKQSFIF